mmetsp:Transcript_15696/g.17724  ORF Transcript_15696/g.17724 Transcript_15696/m.17724 type:complete len:447 (+) Transcript_15696:430-1770(+)
MYTTDFDKLTGVVTLVSGTSGTTFIYAGRRRTAEDDVKSADVEGYLYAQCAPLMFKNEKVARKSSFTFPFGSFGSEDISQVILANDVKTFHTNPHLSVYATHGWSIIVFKVRQKLWSKIESGLVGYLSFEKLPVRAYDASYFLASDIDEGDRVKIFHFSDTGTREKKSIGNQFLHKSTGEIVYVSESLFLTTAKVEDGAVGAAVMVKNTWVGIVYATVRNNKTQEVLFTVVRRIALNDLIRHYAMEVNENERRRLLTTMPKPPMNDTWQAEVMGALEDANQYPNLVYNGSVTLDEVLVKNLHQRKLTTTQMNALRSMSTDGLKFELLDYIKCLKGEPSSFRASPKSKLESVQKLLRRNEKLFLRYLVTEKRKHLAILHVDATLVLRYASQNLRTLLVYYIRDTVNTKTAKKRDTPDFFLVAHAVGKDVSFFQSQKAYRDSCVLPNF